jgi:hypothetical protein
LDGGEIREIPIFNEIGDRGISSMAYSSKKNKLYFSTGEILCAAYLEEKKIMKIGDFNFSDIHEISIIDDFLWIANTGFNQAVKIDIGTDEIVERIPISVGSDSSNRRFHCNQIFRDSEGDYYALVHHVDGRQILKVIRGKLIKSQGDGGIININHNEKRKDLGLNAPHSFREVGDENWVFSSGEQEIRRYSRSWRFLGSIPTSGWGRGGHYDHGKGVYFAGMSPIRLRYAGIFKASKIRFPAVEMIDVGIKESLGTIEIPNIEQINNLVSIPTEIIGVLNKIDTIKT